MENVAVQMTLGGCSTAIGKYTWPSQLLVSKYFVGYLFISNFLLLLEAVCPLSELAKGHPCVEEGLQPSLVKLKFCQQQASRSSCFSILLVDVKDMESPPHKLIELLICPGLLAFHHLGGPSDPLASGLWPPNVALQPPWPVAFNKPINFIIGSFTESFMEI